MVCGLRSTLTPGEPARLHSGPGGSVSRAPNGLYCYVPNKSLVFGDAELGMVGTVDLFEGLPFLF